MGQVLLKDLETGITTDLQLNGYCFDAKEGSNARRFVLSFNGSEATGISNATKAEVATPEIYTLDGRHAIQATKGFYVVRKGQQTEKMIVK